MVCGVIAVRSMPTWRPEKAWEEVEIEADGMDVSEMNFCFMGRPPGRDVT